MKKRSVEESLMQAFPSSAKPTAEAFNSFVRFSGVEKPANDSVMTFRDSTVALLSYTH